MTPVLLAVVIAAAVPANLFPLLYASRPWHRSLIGRALMTKATGLALFIDEYLLRLAIGDYPGDEVVRFTVYAMVTAGIWFQFIALVLSIRRLDIKEQP